LRHTARASEVEIVGAIEEIAAGVSADGTKP